ncbi:hypothetical protein [Bradyrhizobium sp. RDI18]
MSRQAGMPDVSTQNLTKAEASKLIDEMRERLEQAPSETSRAPSSLDRG